MRRWMSVLLLTFAFSVMLVGCGGATDDRPTIVTSVQPLQSIVAQLVGAEVRVVALAPAGANPHTFEPSDADRAAMDAAALIVQVGLDFDPWMGEPTDGKPALSMATLTGVGPSRQGDAPNAYLWQDPQLARKFIEAIAPELAARFPAQADAIAQRAEALSAELVAMDDAFRRQLWSAPIKGVVTYDEAFDRLVQRYSLNVAAHLTSLRNTPDGAVQNDAIVEAIQKVKGSQAIALYVEPWFADTDAVELLEERGGARIIKLDPFGQPGVEGYETYQAMMRTNVERLVAGQTPGTR